MDRVIRCRGERPEDRWPDRARADGGLRGGAAVWNPALLPVRAAGNSRALVRLQERAASLRRSVLDRSGGWRGDHPLPLSSARSIALTVLMSCATVSTRPDTSSTAARLSS